MQAAGRPTNNHCQIVNRSCCADEITVQTPSDRLENAAQRAQKKEVEAGSTFAKNCETVKRYNIFNFST